jgi:hypothetical protein
MILEKLIKKPRTMPYVLAALSAAFLQPGDYRRCLKYISNLLIDNLTICVSL